MRKNLYITLVLSLLALPSFAQEAEKQGPKVGLVLSGGGAKGIAHIGVLKKLEESGVRIDYIGGTSMGAIIGGMYAAGYTATELDSIFRSTNFGELIPDDVPRHAMTFYERDDSETHAVTLPFDDFKLTFPSGISKGQNVYNLFSKLLLHVNDVDDFSELPIPFFCIATDIETGKEVMLDKGYLPRAMRASMAIPSVFSPVTINDTILVDGGVVNNYPIDEVKAMGAEIIIGVDVQDTLVDRNELKSALEILNQITNFNTIEAMKGKREKTDIYIKPDIKGFSMLSFDEGYKILESGENAVDPWMEQLRQIAVQQGSPKRELVPKVKLDEFRLKEVNIEGNNNYTRSYILGKLKLRPGRVVSLDDFRDGINNLSATENFDVIDYRFVEDPTTPDSYSLDFTVKESKSRHYIRFGAHYDDLYKSAVLVNLTRKRLITNNDVLSLDIGLGDNLRYDLNYYIDKGYYWSVGFNSSYNTFEQGVSSDFIVESTVAEDDQFINEVELEYRDFNNQLFVQTVFARTFMLRLGGEYKWLRYLSETFNIDPEQQPTTVFEDSHYVSVYGQMRYDTFDNKFYPSKGFFFDGDFHWYLVGEGANKNFNPFSIAKARLGFAFRPLNKFSVVLSTEGGFKLGDRNTPSLDFFLGGYGFKPLNNIVELYGYEPLSLRGDTYLKALIDLDFEFIEDNHIVASANIANVGDQLFETGNWIDAIDYTGYALGYGLETFFGPVEVKYSYSPEFKTDEWLVNIGFRF